MSQMGASGEMVARRGHGFGDVRLGRLGGPYMTMTAMALAAAASGTASTAFSVVWCGLRRRAIASEDELVLERLRGGGELAAEDAEWVDVTCRQAALGMVEPQTVSALAGLGLLDGCEAVAGPKLTLRSTGGMPLPALWLASSVATGLAVGALTGSAPAVMASGCAWALAECDWAHRSIAVVPCVAMVALGCWQAGLGAGVCVGAAVAVAAAATGLRWAEGRIPTLGMGVGDLLLMAAMAASLLSVRRVFALCAASVAVLGGLLLAKRARGTQGEPVALAPWLLLPYLVGVCA